MALNREQKRMLQKRGELGPDGEPIRTPRPQQSGRSPRESNEPRLLSRDGLKEVRAELRKVAWPTRSETINYSIIVGIALVIMTAFIFAIDWVFSEAVLRLFDA
jgi:preprotein translocase subunit SecE